MQRERGDAELPNDINFVQNRGWQGQKQKHQKIQKKKQQQQHAMRLGFFKHF